MTDRRQVGTKAVRRGLLLVAALVVLAGCRLDVDVGVTVNADGTGEIAVTAAIDADVVAQAGADLAGALQVADAQDAGWTVEGPTPTDSGGLTITLKHPFATPEEASNLLRSIGPPIARDVSITRSVSGDETMFTILGGAKLAADSFEVFADQELVSGAGGVPFAEQIAASGAVPSQAMTVELSIRLPGDIERTSGDRRDGAVVWELPLDGSLVDLSTQSVLRPGDGGSSWAGPVAKVALVLLVLWLFLATAFVVRVVQVRNRRRNRPRGGRGGSPYVSNRYR